MTAGGTLILPVREELSAVGHSCATLSNALRSPSMSTTSGPETSGQDEPEPPDTEKPEYQEKSSPGVEIGMMPEGEGSSFEPEEDPEAQG